MENPFVSEAYIKPGTKVFHINDGYYYYHHSVASNRIHLRCVNVRKGKCPGRMNMAEDVALRTVADVRFGEKPHNHSEMRDWFTEQCARYRCLLRSEEESTPFQTIYKEETSHLPANIAKNIPYHPFNVAMYRARKKAHPKIPECGNEDEQEQIADDPRLYEEVTDQDLVGNPVCSLEETEGLTEICRDTENTFVSEAYIKHGTKVFHINDGFYYYHHEVHSQRVNLRCVNVRKTQCPGRMSIAEDVALRTVADVKFGDKPHNHSQMREWFTEQSARYRCILRSEEETTPFQTIYKEETSHLPMDIAKNIPFYVHTLSAMYRARNKAQSEIPESENEKGNELADNPRLSSRSLLRMNQKALTEIPHSQTEDGQEQFADNPPPHGKVTNQDRVGNPLCSMEEMEAPTQFSRERENTFVSEARIRTGTRVFHVNDGFYYYFHRFGKQRVFLRCVNVRKTPSCPGRMSMAKDVALRTLADVKFSERPHNHPQMREWLAEQQARFRCLKRSEVKDTGYRKVYNEEMSRLPEKVAGNLSFKALKRAMYRARKRAEADFLSSINGNDKEYEKTEEVQELYSVENMDSNSNLPNHSASKQRKAAQNRKSSVEKSALRNQRTYVGAKPFSCESCGKSFYRQSTLTQHLCEDLSGAQESTTLWYWTW